MGAGFIGCKKLDDKIAAAAFQQVDKDGSGYLDNDEMKAALKEFSTAAQLPPPNDAEVDGIMKELDRNGDGKLSPAEFRVLINAILKAIEASQ